MEVAKGDAQKAASRDDESRPGDGIRLALTRCDRLLQAVEDLLIDQERRSLSIDRISRQAGVSRKEFCELFADAEDAFATAVEDALERLWASIRLRVEGAGAEWADQVTATVVGLLVELQADPGRAWLCIVEPVNANRRAQDARAAFIDDLVKLVEQGPMPEGSDRNAKGAASGAIGMLWESALRLVASDDHAVQAGEVAGAGTFLALSPHLGRELALQHAAAASAAVGEAGSGVERDALGSTPVAASVSALVHVLPATALETMRYIGARGAVLTAEIVTAIDILSEEQVDRHLGELEDQSLIVHKGRSAWVLTDRGERVVQQSSMV